MLVLRPDDQCFWDDMDPNGYNSEFTYLSTQLTHLHTTNPARNGLYTHAKYSLSRSIARDRRLQSFAPLVNGVYQKLNNPTGFTLLNGLIQRAITNRTLKSSGADINFNGFATPSVIEHFELDTPITIFGVTHRFILRVSWYDNPHGGFVHGDSVHGDSVHGDENITEDSVHEDNSVSEIISENASEIISEDNSADGSPGGHSFNESLNSVNESINALSSYGNTANVLQPRRQYLDPHKWASYTPSKTLYLPTNYYNAIVWRDINNDVARHINPPVARLRNRQLMRPFHDIEHEYRLRPVSDVIPTYSILTDSMHTNNTPHGQIDIYPNKLRLGFNHYAVITTFGNGQSTTRVRIGDEGEIKKVESQSLIFNSPDEKVEVNSDNISNRVKVKINDEYPTNYYFGYKALLTANGMPAIAKLKIPITAKVTISPFETKARCNQVQCVCIYQFVVNDGTLIFTDYVTSAYNFVYKGLRMTYTCGREYTEPIWNSSADNHDPNPHACEPGLHFCFSLEDALRFHNVANRPIANIEVFRTEAFERSDANMIPGNAPLNNTYMNGHHDNNV